MTVVAGFGCIVLGMVPLIYGARRWNEGGMYLTIAACGACLVVYGMTLAVS